VASRSNGKLANRSWSDALQSNPGLAALIFGGIGTLGFLAIVGIGNLVESHTHSHHNLEDEIFIAVLIAGLAGLAYAIYTFRQVWPMAVELVRSLQWYNWLWFLIMVSGLIFRKRVATEGINNPVDSAAFFRIAVVGIVGLTMLCALFLRRQEWLGSAFTGIVGGLMAFDLVALTSSLWSVYWLWTFYKAVEYGVDVCCLALVIYMCRSSKDWKRQTDWNWILYGMLLLNVWFGCVWDPADALMKSGRYGVEGIGGLGVWLQGVFPDLSSNSIGEFAACITAVAVCRLLPLNRRRVNTAWYLTIFVAGFITMIFAQTRSAFGGFCVAVFFIYLMSNRVGQGAAICIGGSLAAIGLGWGNVVLDYLKRGQSSSQLDSLSSRVEWWQAALEKFGNYSLTGMGMWAAARFGVLAQIGRAQTATIHSDWVEIVVGTGIWGVIPVVSVLLYSWYLLLRYTVSSKLDLYDRQLAYEGLAVLCVITVRMVFMTDLSLHPPLHVFTALGAAEFLRRKLKHPERFQEHDTPATQLSAAAGV
jgi:hypothetical protein